MVTHVTLLSQKHSYGAGMVFVPAAVAALASLLLEGPVGGSFAFFLSCAGMGGLCAAWASMIASMLNPRPGQGRIAAFRSAQLERWALEGLVFGSAIGLVLVLLDAWVIS